MTDAVLHRLEVAHDQPDIPEDLLDACREIGFTGPFVIESFTSKVKSIARAAAIWRPLAESQDQLAESGLRFLRGLLN